MYNVCGLLKISLYCHGKSLFVHLNFRCTFIELLHLMWPYIEYFLHAPLDVNKLCRELAIRRSKLYSCTCSDTGRMKVEYCYCIDEDNKVVLHKGRNWL